VLVTTRAISRRSSGLAFRVNTNFDFRDPVEKIPHSEVGLLLNVLVHHTVSMVTTS